jgi:hypothetical protein
MSEAPKATTVEPEAKRGYAAWKEQHEAISERNAQARKRGNAERKIALSRVFEQRRVNARRESEQLQLLNDRLSKARARG